jgi:hypothetical protein
MIIRAIRSNFSQKKMVFFMVTQDLEAMQKTSTIIYEKVKKKEFSSFKLKLQNNKKLK